MGLFGFLPGGCPPVTEQTRMEVNNMIYSAIAEYGITYPGLTPRFPQACVMALTSLSVAPSRMIPCGVSAQWTASYRAWYRWILEAGRPEPITRTISRTIPGSATLPRTDSGTIDPSAQVVLNQWAQMVGNTYYARDFTILRKEAAPRINEAIARAHP